MLLFIENHMIRLGSLVDIHAEKNGNVKYSVSEFTTNHIFNIDRTQIVKIQRDDIKFKRIKIKQITDTFHILIYTHNNVLITIYGVDKDECFEQFMNAIQ